MFHHFGIRKIDFGCHVIIREAIKLFCQTAERLLDVRLDSDFRQLPGMLGLGSIIGCALHVNETTPFTGKFTLFQLDFAGAAPRLSRRAMVRD
jgi:hypothetical protein